MKNRTENISVRYRPQHLTKSRIFLYNESKNPARILAIFMVLGSAVGLKLIG